MLGLREKQVYDFIREFKKRNGKVPSARQITSQLGFKSSRSAQNYITALKSKGYLIDREPETSSYVLAEDAKSMMGIPFVGKIAAGHPAEAYAQTDHVIEMPYGFFGESDGQGLFALQVMGNSMSGDFICEGDIAIIKKQRDGFRKDDILAVRVGSEEFTLKRLNKIKNLIQLLPSNAQYPVLEVASEQVTVIGKYVGLLRRS
jgi:repressor LexA